MQAPRPAGASKSRTQIGHTDAAPKPEASKDRTRTNGITPSATNAR